MSENDENTTLPQPLQPSPEEESDQDKTVQKHAGTIQIPAIPDPDPAAANESQAAPPPEAEAAPAAPPPAPETASPATDQPSSAEPPSAIAAPPATAAPAPAQPAASGAPAPGALPYMSVSDLLDIQIVDEPQISPDGALIAFSLQSNDREANEAKSAIWLVPADKKEGPRALTSGESLDFMPRWSPDGRTLAFLSTRAGAPQIYLLPLNGGEARRLTALPQGVSEYSWRPDGGALLAHSAWKPADDQPEAQQEADETARVYTRLDEQWDGVGYRQNRHQQLWLIPLDGEPQRLTSEPVDLVQSCWSPDGREIAFCANRRPQPDLSVSMALWVLTPATGQMRRLTPEEGLAQMPSWSPDGRYIAYYYAPDQSETANVLPWVAAADGSMPPRSPIPAHEDFTCLAAIIDELRSPADWLGRSQWYPDNKNLLISVHEHGQVHLHRVDIEQDQIVQLTSGNGRYLSPHLSKNGQSIALVRADWFTPGDIWSLEGNGENPRRLTSVNDALMRSRRLIRPKRISWQSADGLTIDAWLYLPALAPGSKAPLILEVHGGPSCAWGESYVHEFQVLAGRGFAVLAANPRGSQGYGEDFCRAVINDWGGKDFGDLMNGLDHVIASEPIDGARLGIGGLSYGGYMTNWAISQTNRFKAAVSRNGVSSLASVSLLSDQTLWFDMAMGGVEQAPSNEDGGSPSSETQPSAGKNRAALHQERSALNFVERITTPLLLLHSEDDLRCPASESLQLFVALRKRRRSVEMVRYPGVGHLLDWPGVGTPAQRVDRLRRTVEWFERFA